MPRQGDENCVTATIVGEMTDQTTLNEARDPRMYLSAERTFLAWIRTGLALMGFGFVVARFGLFLRELQFSEHQIALRPTGFSVGFGTTLLLLGVVMNVIAAFQHIQTVRKITRGEAFDRPSYLAMAIASVLTIVGLAMAAYLLSVK
jgi:putative membrane protein